MSAATARLAAAVTVAYSGLMLEERVLFQDKDFLAFNKLPGELVQADRQGTASLIELLSAERKYRFFQPVHRLDRPASGVVVFAKSKRFFTALTDLFRKRAVEKVYWAVVEHGPEQPAGTLAHRLSPDGRTNRVRARADEAAPNSRLAYRLVGKSERYFFLEVRPDTGRQHQIRAQLAAARMIVKGDVKYGARRANADRSIFLHARALAFTHPFTGRPVRFEAPPPPHPLWELFLQAASGAPGPEEPGSASAI